MTRIEQGELAQYDPDKGLKAIAVAEAAEKYFARAKDIAKLFAAIEEKLKQQRKFVLWWDGKEKAAGSLRRGQSPASPVSNAGTLAEFGVDRTTLHRWRGRLKEIDKFERALATAKERGRRVCEFEKGATEQRGASGTGENEWFTPSPIVDLARHVLGDCIDLDPASHAKAQAYIQAAQWFDKEQDGLKREWHGRIWLNPPYAQPLIAQFIDKTITEWGARHISAAIVLTHNYSDTAWFQALALEASALCFTRGRIRFLDLNGDPCAPTQGQTFFYLGDEADHFAKTFHALGIVLFPE